MLPPFSPSVRAGSSPAGPVSHPWRPVTPRPRSARQARALCIAIRFFVCVSKLDSSCGMAVLNRHTAA